MDMGAALARNLQPEKQVMCQSKLQDTRSASEAEVVVCTRLAPRESVPCVATYAEC
jgi:hypothetical protein